MENACAGGSTAFREAWMSVKAGLYDLVLAVGAEKVWFPEDKEKMFEGFCPAPTWSSPGDDRGVPGRREEEGRGGGLRGKEKKGGPLRRSWTSTPWARACT